MGYVPIFINQLLYKNVYKKCVLLQAWREEHLALLEYSNSAIQTTEFEYLVHIANVFYLFVL